MAEPHAHGEPTDVALVRDVAAGSETALASLYDRHASLVFGAALRLTPDRSRAEDVVLETFLALWNSRRAIRSDPWIAHGVADRRRAARGHRPPSPE